MDPNYSWIYLVIFLIIPLSRIIPRIIAKRRQGSSGYTAQKEGYTAQKEGYTAQKESYPKDPVREPEPQSKDRQVLGSMHSGANTFEKIRKATQIKERDLDSILQELEAQGLLKVVHKQGLLGPRTELYPTDKGFRDYYST